MPSYLIQPKIRSENISVIQNNNINSKSKLNLPIMKILSLRNPIPDENCNFIISQSLSTENQRSNSSEDINPKNQNR